MYLFVKNYQLDEIENFFDKGGKRGSVWIASVIGLGYLAFFMIILIAISFIIPPFAGEVKTFGQIGHEIYYDQTIPEKNIDEVGKALTTL